MIAVAYNQSNGDLYRSKCVFKIYVTVKISAFLTACFSRRGHLLCLPSIFLYPPCYKGCVTSKFLIRWIIKI